MTNKEIAIDSRDLAAEYEHGVCACGSLLDAPPHPDRHFAGCALWFRDQEMDRVRNAVNAACTCGGSGPDDPNCCPACAVWHELKREFSESREAAS